MIVGHEPKRYAELLSPAHLEELSLSACKLYEMVWNRMASREAVEVSILDSHCMNKIKSDAEGLQSVQSELVRAGLLHVEQVRRPKMTAADYRCNYIYADQTEQPNDI